MHHYLVLVAQNNHDSFFDFLQLLKLEPLTIYNIALVLFFVPGEVFAYPLLLLHCYLDPIRFSLYSSNKFLNGSSDCIESHFNNNFVIKKEHLINAYELGYNFDSYINDLNKFSGKF
jgi:hypothetical protein